VPTDGLLLAGIDSPNVARVAAAAQSPVETFGFAAGADWQAVNLRLEPERAVFDVWRSGRPHRSDVVIGQPGRYVVLSALVALALAERLGLDPAVVEDSLAHFQGARRRLELRGEVAGVTVVEDFAHHPTQARTSLETAAVRFPGRRLWCVYDLHTFSSRNRRYLPEYAQAFGQAYGVVLPAMHHPEQIPAEQRLSLPELTEAIRATQPNVAYIPDRPQIVPYLAERVQPGDVVLFMSSGGLEDLIEGLLQAL
jgi:UDP-N-acetylmuramate: L-alanyl-gamma-D-glutamyl-meso-diaminopimelate ligase